MLGKQGNLTLEREATCRRSWHRGQKPGAAPETRQDPQSPVRGGVQFWLFLDKHLELSRVQKPLAFFFKVYMEREGKLQGSELYSVRQASSGSPFLSARQGWGQDSGKISVVPGRPYLINEARKSSHLWPAQPTPTSPPAHTAPRNPSPPAHPSSHTPQRTSGRGPQQCGRGTGACTSEDHMPVSLHSCWSATKASRPQNI